MRFSMGLGMEPPRPTKLRFFRLQQLALAMASLVAVACGGSGSGGGGGGSNAATPLHLSVAISNLRNMGVVHSGFVVGTASGTGLSQVEVSLDDGVSWTAASGTASWKFMLPIGTNTWRDGTTHTIQVRSTNGTSYSDIIAISARKGVNRDINGDGYEDRVVGAYNFGGTGRVYVFHSRDGTGLTTSDSPVLASDEADSTLFGDSDSVLGLSVATGDINGDGYADVIAAEQRGPGVGKVYIFHSRGDIGITMSATPVAASSEADATIEGGAGDYFPHSVAVGDINGDGYADLAVGTSEYSSFTGRVWVFHSQGNGGLTSSATPGSAATLASSILYGESPGDSFGLSLALGDLNGDGYTDLVVGAHAYSSVTGRVYAFHSRGGGGLTSTPDPTPAISEADSVLTGESANNSFGLSVALGDVNGDGYADLISGAHGYSTTGRLYVIHSRGAAGLTSDSTPVGVASEADSIIAGGGGEFGTLLGVGDLNGDGHDDVAVSAGGYGSYKGRVYVLLSLGSAGLTSDTVPVDASDSANSILDGEFDGDYFAWVGIGDVNGDGLKDLVVGAPAYVSNANTGRVYVVHSLGTGGITTAATPINAAAVANSILTGEGVGGYFGYGLR